MGCTGLVVEKFVKFISRNDIVKNELIIPPDFNLKYGSRLPPEFVLKLRNGYELPIDFDKQTGRMKGFSVFFRHFNFKGGEFLVFEYYGRYDLNLYIIGKDCSEIDYPYIVHHFQSCEPKTVTLRKGGLRFLMILDPVEKHGDLMEFPKSFMDRCPSMFGMYMRFVLRNGKMFEGTYCHENREVSGLHKMCNILGVPDLSSFHMLLFTYDGVSHTDISVFDANLVEVVFPGTPISTGQSSATSPVVSRFKITVKPFHMYDYCYGVDIPVEFKDLWHMWSKTDHINVYSGNCCWRLEIRHRPDWKRTTIHKGWLQFRDDMKLEVGDVCIFESPKDSLKHFSVRVIKPEV